MAHKKSSFVFIGATLWWISQRCVSVQCANLCEHDRDDHFFSLHTIHFVFTCFAEHNDIKSIFGSDDHRHRCCGSSFFFIIVRLYSLMAFVLVCDISLILLFFFFYLPCGFQFLWGNKWRSGVYGCVNSKIVWNDFSGINIGRIDFNGIRTQFVIRQNTTNQNESLRE